MPSIDGVRSCSEGSRLWLGHRDGYGCQEKNRAMSGLGMGGTVRVSRGVSAHPKQGMGREGGVYELSGCVGRSKATTRGRSDGPAQGFVK